MPNPLVYSAGTTTLNLTHAIKVSKMAAIANSATAGSVILSDLNGNVMGVPLETSATAGAEASQDYVVPLIVPGGASGIAIPGTTVTPSVNAVITVTGAGTVAYLYHR